MSWTVDSVKGGNAAVGTVSATGLYTAPPASGQHTIGAVSQANSKASATTSVTVATTPGLTVLPASATVLVSSQQSFQGQSCGMAASNLSWAVDGVAGGNDAVGIISSGGVYTAPAAAGTHTVQVTDSSQNTSKAAVTVSSGITVDFGGRTDTKFAIPTGILGVNHVDWWYVAGVPQQIANTGLKLSRTYANLPQVYATVQPNWTAIDPQIAKLKAAGFHVLLQLLLTPPWLQPNPNSCTGDKSKAPPTSPSAWALLAKSYVAHMDATFPGVVTDYEIWNEPDAGGMCGTTDKLASYEALYAAAAPLMKQQARADGATIRVGGPAASNMNTTWFQALLSDPATAPYVDFVSYHQYFAGSANSNAAWDTNNGTASIYSLTQDPTIGAASTYAAARRVVAAGKQPNASATPIYIDEFNTNWAFVKDCCRNNPTYSPVWNALYVSDVMNTVYSGTPHLPAQLTYYAAVSLPYFCLVGDWNANMDCSHTSGAPVPYPQYYAYQLMASTNYLGMNDGGYMAASAASAPAGRGISALAFYTPSQDSILIVNPTSKSYSDVVSLENLGIRSPSATLYQIVGGKSISKTALKLTDTGTTYTASINVPAYTVLGITLK